MRSPLLPLALVALLAGCSGREAAPTAAAAPADPIAVEVAAPSLEERPLVLALDGTLLADEDSRVTSTVPGRVVETLVERGQRVEEGDPIVRLRDVDYRLQARAARAQVDQARARLGMGEGGAAPRPEDTPEVRAAQTDLELAEANLRRAEELARRGALSQQALEQSRATAASARDRHQSAVNGTRGALASLEAARASLAQAATATREATVRAPFAGEIAERSVSVGEYVGPQTPLVTLVRTDPLRLSLSVPQQHLLAVRPGQPVSVRVDAVPDRVFAGTVRYVSAAVDRSTRSLTVEAVVPNGDGLLRPGLFASARIETGGTQQMLVVPPSAVLSRAGVDRVFVIDGDVVAERVVTVASRTDDERYVIQEGLEPGERVAASSLDQLSDGARVSTSDVAEVSAAAGPDGAGVEE